MSDLVVHYLLRGLTLCQFTRELPGSWPANHTWVSLPSHREQNKDANCQTCREVLDQLLWCAR